MDEENNKQIAANEGRRSSKKRKLSTGEISSTSIKIEVLQYENQKLEEYVQKLEVEKRQHIDGCNAEKILELEDTVAKLQTIVSKNKEEKNQHKTEMDFVKNEYKTKITNEKRESRAKIQELNNKIALLETVKHEPKDSVENELETLQNENDTLHSEVIELKNKIGIFEVEKQNFEAKIQELNDEISLMKSIKTETKDPVESERETFQAEKDKLKIEIDELKNHVDLLEQNNQNLVEMHAKEMKNLKKKKDSAEKKLRENIQPEQKLKEEKKRHKIAEDKLRSEIKQLKTQNSSLEKVAQETKIQLCDSEKRNNANRKKFGETVTAYQQLKQKCEELEATINKNMKEYQSIIDDLKTDNKDLLKFNNELLNNEKELQNSINKLKNKVEKMEKDGSEMKILSLDEIFNGSKFKTSLLSCKSNIVVNVTKLEKTFKGWNLYSTTNNSEKPRFLTDREMLSNCFSLNINGQIHFKWENASTINKIMHKINTCELTKLYLNWLTIDLADYIKLTALKKIEICVFDWATVKLNTGTIEELSVDQLLTHLPNIKEFKFEYFGYEKDHSSLAKNLGQLEPFSDLQKFEIFNLSESFKFEDLETFVKKNNKDISYTFTFSGENPENMQKEIQTAVKNLLKSLLFPCKIRIGYKGKNYLCPTVWV